MCSTYVSSFASPLQVSESFGGQPSKAGLASRNFSEGWQALVDKLRTLRPGERELLSILWRIFLSSMPACDILFSHV